MADLQELRATLRLFQERFPRPGVCILQFSDPYDFDRDWPELWPNAAQAGVYALCNASGEVLYIGEASCLGHRLSAHFQYGEGNRPQARRDEFRNVRLVLTVGLPEGHEFEAPAIEKYLIAQLNPKLNVLGVTLAENPPQHRPGGPGPRGEGTRGLCDP